ncbi:MAG: glycoside hydrolase family 1 protein [Gemmatimonadales bacterium]|nr:glycoside hydrolase family 1 protein [Gemmatimonadales bacterium]
MPIKLLGRRPEDFMWATGIEDTFVPQTRPGHRALDEYQLMGHYEHWREDLALVRDLGLKAVRWGVPWYRVEPFQSGEYDWRWTDQVIPYMVEELGVTPIIDLIHYGCPFWLRREFASAEYPTAIASFADAFARRYAGLVHWYTPLNEPIVTALYCGQRGLWPPYLRSETGYVTVLLQVVEGIIRTAAALRAVDPGIRLVHVDASGLSRTAREDLHVLAKDEQSRTFLPFDLLTGRVTPDHPLFPWLVRSGASPDQLAAMARQPVPFDLMGLNFYPQWSTTQLYIDRRGRLAYQPVDQDGAGFIDLIEDYWQRYRIPIMVTETSARGGEDVRARWLEASVTAIRTLRSRGVPVLGYTWFPLFTMIDWRYRFGRGPVEEYRLELGLYTLDGAAGSSRWRATPLVEQLRSYVTDPDGAVGNLGVGESPPLARV